VYNNIKSYFCKRLDKNMIRTILFVLEGKMTKEEHHALINDQKKTKPEIENVIKNFLKGDSLKNAMDFISFLKDNNMNPRWASGNKWRVTGKKSKPICVIYLGGLNHHYSAYLKIGDWQIMELEGLERKYLDEFSSDDIMKEFVWANVKPCVRCGSCGPHKRAYIGKKFDECCGLYIINPGAKELKLVKKLVEVNKAFTYANA
jgi:hypothetical protein